MNVSFIKGTLCCITGMERSKIQVKSSKVSELKGTVMESAALKLRMH